jgi:catechol 2,3-dioxygenase-like lactoylglutathione lyase family enzyme
MSYQLPSIGSANQGFRTKTMKKSFAIFPVANVFATKCSRYHPRMKIHELNHVAIHVADVARSGAFYRDVLRLEALPRPAFDFPGAWFRLGRTQELHLIGRRMEQTPPVNRNNHFALRVDDLAAWEKHFSEIRADFQPRKQRPDGAQQIFLCDPDGHFIELFNF